jgi:hypothetical protein
MRGRKPQANSVRDTVIAWAAGMIAYRYGLKPTRGQAAKEKGTTESGCSIVQKALSGLGGHMTEENVNAIWRDRGPHDETRAARIKATLAVNALRRTHSRGLGNAEWLKKNDPRELTRAWRQRETRRVLGKGTGRRKNRALMDA